MHLFTSLFAKLFDFWYQISWPIAANRVLFVLLLVLLGLFIANLPRRHAGPTRPLHAYLLRSIVGVLTGLTLSTAFVAASALTHAADARWLPPNERQTPHISAPAVPKPPNVPLVGGALGVVTNSVNGGLKDMAGGTNAAIRPLFDLEVQARALQVSTRVIFQYSLIAITSGMVLAALLAFTYQTTQRNYRRRLARTEHQIKVLEDQMNQILTPQR